MASKKTWLMQHAEDPNLFGGPSMDIVYDSGGRLVALDGVEKLRMLLVKCVLTGRYLEEDISYGSTVSRLLGQKSRVSNTLNDGMYLMAVDRALESFRQAQPSDLDSAEKMIRLDGEITVNRDRKDRTILLVGASVRNGLGQVVSVVHSFRTF